MQYGTPHAQCQICKRTIQPHEPLIFQDGVLFHTRCFEQRTRQCTKAERQAYTLLPENS